MGESQLCGMCTMLQRDECNSFKSWKQTDKQKTKSTSWDPDWPWPFRLRSVHIPNQVSQHKLPALLLTASQEVTTLLSPNSNHEHNTFPNENARCPFPLLLVFIPVHTSYTKSPGLSRLDASIISLIKCMSHLTSRKIDANACKISGYLHNICKLWHLSIYLLM